MIWLLNTKNWPWSDSIKHFARENNCTVLSTSTPVPQWLKCSEEDFLLIKLKSPELISTFFTDRDFHKQLRKISAPPAHLTKMDCLALNIRRKWI